MSGEPSAERRLPREAMWFFLVAPPALALLFDPHCLSTLDNMLRAWVALTLYTCATGVAVHAAFEQLAPRIARWALAPRLVAHGAVTCVVVAAATLAQHWYVRMIYPEIGDDIAGVIGRGVLVSIVYLAVAAFIGGLQRQAVAERMKAHLEKSAALEARLQMLQAQMQPHFLFNSLNVCAGLVHTAPDAAEATIDKLSAFLRYALESSERRLVPLADELRAVGAYLHIQHERFGDRLRHEIIAPRPEDPAPELPPMLLQPLVENAIVHGLSAGAGGLVRIECRRNGDRFEISIADTGGAGGEARPGTGHGQRNVRERLRLVYGEGAELRCGASSDGGYTSLLSLPLSGAS
ncbi:MAG: histidine kinase [Myxococcota bacterium]|nr:histidine kinase [Myxococcota bacterium]